jgi:hypothetical protein
MENIRIDIHEQQSLALSKQMTDEARQLLATAQVIEIDCPELYELAADELMAAKAKARQLDDLRRSMTRPRGEAKQRIMDFFRPAVEFLQQTEASYKGAMMRWHGEQERLRREEEARQREAARTERERLYAEAQAAADAGHPDEADAISETEKLIPMPIVPPTVEKISGVSTRKVWRAEVIDKLALIKAVAAGRVPEALLEVNMVVLNAQARALKSAMNYPGVKAVAEGTIAASRKTSEVA